VPPIRIGVSACLLGANVRYDGQHKRDALLLDELGPRVEWVSVCPELEVGMGVPREPVRLVRADRAERVRMLGVESGDDWTARMSAFAEARADALAAEDLSGFVLKSRSPSCGLEVARYDSAAPEAAAVGSGEGLFAAALARRLPDLPIEEEARLRDRPALEAFMARVLAYRDTHMRRTRR
jgi:uncharacterized protein YbbK (DUF523 family)